MTDKVQKTREVIEKELLLQDLCARLRFGVKIKIGEHSDYKLIGVVITDEHPIKVEVTENGNPYKIEVSPDIIKPYLRPMSSMTEEEKKEYRKVCELDTEILANHPMNGEPFPALYNSQDWLNAHHFAYRTIDGKDMFELGLALEAQEGMYN